MKLFSPTILLVLFCSFSLTTSAQLILRDTTINWQHHAFELNDDFSMGDYSTTEITQVQFAGKVIENDLIRLVIIPEYGARVISFVYKPTGYEYLYQSECGSPYGIYAGNFYYDWLMVYGGIFPTFPEPEHGKTWFLTWEYSLIKNTADTITIRMEYTDDTQYTNAPGGFNNGITNITCQVDVSVYSNSSLWDFDVKLINNNNSTVNYEYWTCTTLTPGSEIGNTGSPLNTEMITPIDFYKAAWSPGSWIGNWGSLYDYSDINYLSEWEDMGIAYAHELSENYWGVINHNNNEGILRISDNVETPGMKFWTWGSNNVNNNLFDFNNGGADNYIELWAGNSLAFFEDATLSSNQEKSWKESYVATTNMSGILAINNQVAINAKAINSFASLAFELNKFNKDEAYTIIVRLQGISDDLLNKSYDSDQIIVSETLDLASLNLEGGTYNLQTIVEDNSGKELLNSLNALTLYPTEIRNSEITDLEIQQIGNHNIYVKLPEIMGSAKVQLVDMNGRLIDQGHSNVECIQLSAMHSGIYIIQLNTMNQVCTQKIWIE